MAKLFWVSANGEAPWEQRKETVTAALEAGADAILVNDDEADKVKELGNIDIIGQDLKAKFIEIKNKSDEERAAREIGEVPVVVTTTDWTIIPLENLIAAKDKRGGSLIAKVDSVESAKVAFETLEKGVDGILFAGKAPEISQVKGLIDKMSAMQMELRIAKIASVKPVGMGDRVCVDTCSIFSRGEGMLVGSSSSALFLVHAETIESPYVAARPFRVNAGPVHAYTLLPNGKTTYLSELEGGDEVLAVDPNGNTRVLTVGRLKVEKRPLMLVEAKVDGSSKVVKTILQNAETIRLTAPGGDAISVAKLKEGSEVLVYVEEGGRHFGMAIEESIEEK